MPAERATLICPPTVNAGSFASSGAGVDQGDRQRREHTRVVRLSVACGESNLVNGSGMPASSTIVRLVDTRPVHNTFTEYRPLTQRSTNTVLSQHRAHSSL